MKCPSALINVLRYSACLFYLHSTFSMTFSFLWYKAKVYIHTYYCLDLLFYISPLIDNIWYWFSIFGLASLTRQSPVPTKLQPAPWFHFSCDYTVFHWVLTTQLLHALIFLWTFGLFSYPGYLLNVTVNMVHMTVLGVVSAKKWNHWVVQWELFFLRNVHSVSTETEQTFPLAINEATLFIITPLTLFL